MNVQKWQVFAQRVTYYVVIIIVVLHQYNVYHIDMLNNVTVILQIGILI